jgi:chromosomal replication initiation ATPase DnaA
MSGNKQFVALLNNIKEGLKTHTPEELNAAIIEVLNSKHDKAPEIKFVILAVCKKFSISKRTLIKSSARGDIQQARQLTYCLLHMDLGLSIRHVAKKVFNKFPNSVAVAIKYHRNCDEKIPSEREFMEKYAALRNELIEYIKEQNTENG